MDIQLFNQYKRAALERVFWRLNNRQQEAVFRVKGPLLVLAGAGSGKTTVLINRIAYLLKYGNAYESEKIPDGLTDGDMDFLRDFPTSECPDEERLAALLCTDRPRPWEVMAITFTNKAAGELRERLERSLGASDAGDVWASTFHSACARILRRDADRLQMTRDFTIYDTDESKTLIKNILSDLAVSDKSLSPRDVLSAISGAKNRFVDAEEYAITCGGDYRKKIIASIFDEYQRRLHSGNAMDFDDLLLNTVRLFSENADVLDYYSNRLKYILVDEYQDTNMVQYKLVSMLAHRSGNLCVVGDDDQSIYGFRGATIENILSFEESFPNAKVVRLEQNYRSTGNILDAANAVIAKNEGRKGKTLWTAGEKGEKILQQFCPDERGEAEFIAETIKKDFSKRGGAKYSDYAILYRVNAVGATIERSLNSKRIPYRIYGGTRFYDRKEIRDMVSYLTVLCNDSDIVRLSRIINEPKRGIGDSTVATVCRLSEELSVPVMKIIAESDSYAVLSGKTKALSAFWEMISSLRRMLDEGAALSEVYMELLDKSGYTAMLETGDIQEQARLENIYELLSQIKKYEKSSPDADLRGFLEDCALMTDYDNHDDSAETVVLMTVHGAKGLEFDTVFVAACEEEIFPSRLSLTSTSEVEEERRLAYVAFTRAKRRLILSHTGTRMLYGATMRNNLSRFADDIPDELKDVKKPPSERLQGSFGGYTGGYSGSSRYQSNPYTVSTPRPQRPSAGGISPQRPAASNAKYSVGMRVTHPSFGGGMITAFTPMGGDTLLEIAFDSCGTKRLMANFARLKTEN